MRKPAAMLKKTRVVKTVAAPRVAYALGTPVCDSRRFRVCARARVSDAALRGNPVMSGDEPGTWRAAEERESEKRGGVSEDDSVRRDEGLDEAGK